MWCCAHLYKKIQKIIRILKYWYVTVFNLHKISLWIVLQIYFITSLSCCFCGFYFFWGGVICLIVCCWVFLVFVFSCVFFLLFIIFIFIFFAFFRFNLLLSMQFLFKHFFPCTILVLSIWFHNVILILFIERGQK